MAAVKLTFPRDLRLLKPAQFSRVFQQNCIKAYACGLMLIACSNELDHVRLGLICSTKQQRRAVDRNQFKRLCRELVRQRQHQLPALDVVVLTRKPIKTLDRANLTHQLTLLWNRFDKQYQRLLEQT